MSHQSFPLLTLPLLLTAAVGAERFVTATGTLTGAAAGAIGVTRSSGVAGERVSTDVLGTAVVAAGAAIAVGDTLKSDAAGRAIPRAGAGTALAVALQAATAADERIEVLLIPSAA